MFESLFLTGILIDRVDSDGVFSSGKDRLPLEIRRAAGPVGQEHEPAVGMYMNGPCGLSRADVAGVGERIFGEQWLAAEGVVAHNPVHLELVLSLQRYQRGR